VIGEILLDAEVRLTLSLSFLQKKKNH